MEKSNCPAPGGVEIAHSKATFATSRRSFMKATATLGAAVAGIATSSYLTANEALASNGHGHGNGYGKGKGNPPHNGCGPSGNTPPKCCFLPGTQILTPEGEIGIEKLHAGDLIVTISGEAKPIKWVGYRRHERREDQDWDRGTLPVLISSGAFDGVLPSRDLYVSDAHCFFINGLLIPAIHLVNGHSIRKCDSFEADVIEYYHIELDGHDVLFANGAPAETLFGNANREIMDNFDEYVQLYGPELVAMTPFAPVVEHHGGRQELRSLVRSVVAPIYDRRQPLDIIRDAIAERAEQKRAA